jgi:hypothetical protein
MGEPLLAGGAHEYTNEGEELANILTGGLGVLGTVPGIARRTAERPPSPIVLTAAI